jgi:hypothetical protein
MNRPAAAVLGELERACVDAEKALQEQRWPDCDEIWARQRKLTHELELALRDLAMGSPERKAAFARIDRIAKYREGQLRRLRAFHANAGNRLTAFSRFRRMSKTVGVAQRSRLLDSTF